MRFTPIPARARRACGGKRPAPCRKREGEKSFLRFFAGKPGPDGRRAISAAGKASFPEKVEGFAYRHLDADVGRVGAATDLCLAVAFCIHEVGGTVDAGVGNGPFSAAGGRQVDIKDPVGIGHDPIAD